MGEEHDKVVKEWKLDVEANPDVPLFQIIGDNLDLQFKAKTKTVFHLNHDNHWYNAIAMRDTVTGMHLSQYHQRKLCDVPLHEFIPNTNVLKSLRENFVVLWSRAIVKRLANLSILRRAIIYHIDHEYSELMAEKTEEVCFP